MIRLQPDTVPGDLLPMATGRFRTPPSVACRQWRSAVSGFRPFCWVRPAVCSINCAVSSNFPTIMSYILHGCPFKSKWLQHPCLTTKIMPHDGLNEIAPFRGAISRTTGRFGNLRPSDGLISLARPDSDRFSRAGREITPREGAISRKTG